MHTAFRLGSLLAGLLLALSMAAPALAAKDEEREGPPYVDLEKVLAQYQKTSAFAKYAQRLAAQAKTLNAEMETLAQLRYATDAERKEALAIKAKPSPSTRETARLNALFKKSDDIDNELAQLSQKQPPSDADTKRLQTLSQMRTDAARNLAKEEADRRDQLRKLDSDLREEVENELLKLVEKVAKDQKLGFIYERRAILFGGTDYTDEVVKKLPK